jgi:hypothetical protein
LVTVQAGDSFGGTSSQTFTVAVQKGTPSGTVGPDNIVYGTSLAGAQLGTSLGGVTGTFDFGGPEGTQLDVGSYTESYTFTPGDTADYNSATGTATVNVSQATPTFIWTPVYVTYDGQPHGITAEVHGVGTTDLGPATIAYSTSDGAVPVDVGVYDVTLGFAGTTDYAPISSTFSPAVTITAPASNPGANQFVLVIDDPNTPNSEVIIADGASAGTKVVGPGGVSMVTTAASQVNIPGMIMYMQPVGAFSFQMTIAMSSPMLTGDALFVDTMAMSQGAGNLNVLASASGYLPTDHGANAHESDSQPVKSETKNFADVQDMKTSSASHDRFWSSFRGLDDHGKIGGLSESEFASDLVFSEAAQ